MAKHKFVTSANPDWHPTPEQIQHFLTKFKCGIWRADQNQPWRDKASMIVDGPAAALDAQCGYAIFELQSSGYWNLYEDHCTGDCQPVAPGPPTSSHPVGTQVVVPCGHPTEDP